MNHLKTGNTLNVAIIAVTLAVGLYGVFVSQSFGHGGKTHADKAFTALQALQKATLLYDKLTVSGKLTEEWETGLKTITINTRQSAERQEHVIQFERAVGDPASVFFFFDQEGTYSGSNLTGE